MIGICALNLFNDLLIYVASLLRVKTDHDIKADRLLFFVQIKAVHLKDIRDIHHDALYILPYFDRFGIGSIYRIYTDGRKYDIVFEIDLHR